MSFIMNSLILETLFLCSLPFIVLFIKSFFTYRYWKQKKVPYLKPSFPFGNYTKTSLFLRPTHEVNTAFYNKIKYEMKLPYAGLYNLQNPVLMLTDTELLKHIFIKDFDHFVHRGLNDVDEEKDPILAHLFNKKEGWRQIRNKMSPAFSSGKMKLMYPLIEKCVESLEATIANQFRDAEEVELNMKDYCMRFTTDVIVSTAFGVDANTLTDENSEFLTISHTTKADQLPRKMKKILLTLVPLVRKLLDVPLVDTRLANFFSDLAHRNIEFREKNNVKRVDFLDNLIQFRNEQKDKELSEGDVRITDNFIAAQSFGIYVAGFETSSVALSFCLFELAKNPEIQSNLRKEILSAKKEAGGKLEYESLQKMPLLDKVLKETLRMYPTAPQLDRIAGKQYQLPGTTLTLDVGTRILVPLWAIHHDPEIYPDPEKFDPERFAPENVQSRPNYTYLPFGEGPRNCIGMRFGVLQFKTGLASLISNFEFNLHPVKTRQDFVNGSFIINTKNPLVLKVKQTL